MTFEETYAAQWRKDAYAEGHRRGLPVKANFGTTKANIEARAEVLDAIKKGNSSVKDIASFTGYDQQFIRDRLRYLVSYGKVFKTGTKWSIAE